MIAREEKMKIDTKGFLVRPGEKVKLKDWPTCVKPMYGSKEEYKEVLEKHVKQLSEMQQLLYGSNQYAVLLVFQGMDAAGKDGAIAHVMSGVNPQGCEVASFKQPSAEELEHDFLWRSERSCRAWADRHLQPLVLRGSAGGPGAPGDAAWAKGWGRSCAREGRWRSGIAPLWIWSGIWIVTARGS